MTGARISFTCDTNDDADVVAWLDSFGSRERGFAIKAAIRNYILVEQGVESDVEVDRLSLIEDKLSDIFRQIVDIRKQGLALSINNDIINTDLSLDSDKLDPAVESNIGKLFEN